MRDHVATLMSDYYKQAHAEQYPEDMTLLVDYLTPRTCRLEGVDYLISFGHQGFVKEFLVEYFNRTFFNIPEEQAIKEHERVIKYTLSKDNVSIDKIRDLHRLGYLPIEIRVIPEGTKVPIHVPILEIRNTHPDFIWVVGFIESVMSCELWYPMTVANQSYHYREIASKYYNKTVENGENLVKHAISEFGFRGGKGREAGILASAAFLTSFDKTATIPALLYLEDYYNCNIEDGTVGGGMISTEHSVMCSNYALDGDEKTFLNKLFTEIYPTENVSVVCDSYDYWNTVGNIICKELKDKVMSRNGCIFVRGDSGHPEEIIAGKNKYPLMRDSIQVENFMNKLNTTAAFGDFYFKMLEDGKFRYYKFHKVIGGKCKQAVEVTPDPEDIGTVECLFNAFGGTINSKGYIVLDSHVRAIYGDSITPQLAEEIYSRLEKNGFAACNVALGAGSFSMQCTREGDKLQPFTRDTYGIAIKATYGEMADGTPVEIFKNPKTDTGKFKKSQKGMCFVHYNDEGQIVYEDGYNSKNIPSEDNGNLFVTIFKDGIVMNEQSIYDIRNRLYNNEF